MIAKRPPHSDARVNFFDPDDRSPSAQATPAYGFTTRAEHAAFRVTAALMRALPMEFASAFMGKLWRFVAPHLRRQPRTLAHLAQAFPEKTPEEREAITREMWEFLGRTFAEAFHIDAITADPSRIELVVSDAARRAIEQQGQAVIVSLHMGNWEIAAASAARIGLDIAGVYQSLKNPLVDREVVRMRAKLYPAGIIAKGPDTARILLRRLADGRSISILADTRDSKGIPVKFFGRDAPTGSFAAAVARARGLPIVAGRIVRTGPVRFRADIDLVPTLTTDDKNADIAANTQAIHSLFERWIREYPGQWMWSHRRWG